MKTFQLSAEPRTDLGKKAAQALREEGKIPAVLNGGEIIELPFTGTLKPGEKLVEIENGRGMITTDLTVTNDSVRKLIYTPDIFAVELEYNGEKKMAVLREVQYHPVKDTILHMDFLEVSEKKPVVIAVPVKLEGHAEGVKAGGKLTLSMKKVKVKALYTEIPERLVINVDHLGLGKTLQVGDLNFEGLELVTPKEAVVCAVQLTRAARGAQAAAEAAAKK
ncbi:50S ribosomal protein L25/general stress protein Ctc [Muribaculaceae bacterium Isolate-013 (NCI)]|jgi:large subunit ribosomal protein L25|nr:50S ribosomal protein L25/general stress protein Ctc [Muribaculaceae bacterium Isolate-013 (NCI)]